MWVRTGRRQSIPSRSIESCTGFSNTVPFVACGQINLPCSNRFAGVGGFEKALDTPFDLIILDTVLSLRDGFDVCRDLRQAGLTTPILMLAARSQTVDKVIGLKLGADDYMTKPFAAIELLTRIEALLRRVQVRDSQKVHVFGSLRIDMCRMEVTRDNQPVYLTAREFQLLQYLMERADTAIYSGPRNLDYPIS